MKFGMESVLLNDIFIGLAEGWQDSQIQSRGINPLFIQTTDFPDGTPPFVRDALAGDIPWCDHSLPSRVIRVQKQPGGTERLMVRETKDATFWTLRLCYGCSGLCCAFVDEVRALEE